MRTIYQLQQGRTIWEDITHEEYAKYKFQGAVVRNLLIPPLYAITARTWYSGSGGVEYRAELCDVETGNEIFTLKGHSRGWEYDMRDRMEASGLFPPHEKANPTIYFRDVCNVPYDHREVARKKEL